MAVVKLMQCKKLTYTFTFCLTNVIKTLTLCSGYFTETMPRISNANSSLQHRPMRSRLGKLFRLQRHLWQRKATSCHVLFFCARRPTGAMVNHDRISNAIVPTGMCKLQYLWIVPTGLLPTCQELCFIFRQANPIRHLKYFDLKVKWGSLMQDRDICFFMIRSFVSRTRPFMISDEQNVCEKNVILFQ